MDPSLLIIPLRNLDLILLSDQGLAADNTEEYQKKADPKGRARPNSNCVGVVLKQKIKKKQKSPPHGTARSRRDSKSYPRFPFITAPHRPSSRAAGNLYLHPRLIWRQVESGRRRRATACPRITSPLARPHNRSKINGLQCLLVPPHHPVMVMR